jgi:capsular polysaccharide biosynthesis protein
VPDHNTPLDQLKRMRWVITAAVLLAVASSVGLAVAMAEPTWEAETQVRVGRLNLDQYTDSAYVERILRTTAEIVEAGSQDLVADEGGDLGVEVLPETELLAISVSHSDMNTASQLLTSVVDASQGEVSDVYDDALSMVILDGSTSVEEVRTNYVLIGVVAGLLTLVLGVVLAITRSVNSAAAADRVSRET